MRDWPKYAIKFGFLDNLSQTRRSKKENEMQDIFKNDHQQWELGKTQLLKKYDEEIIQYNINKQNQEKEYLSSVEKWERERLEYLNKRDAGNTDIDNQKSLYFKGDTKAIIDYCDLVLSASNYPDFIRTSYELDYNTENKILLGDYSLPALNTIPTLKEVRYVQSTSKFVESQITELQLNKLYDQILYQITLRTINELFKADAIDALSSVVFNGYVKSISSSTGQEINPCILSLQANKSKFMEINLANVEPKACFKQLKGIGSSRLYSLTAIAPIMKMDRSDKRFITSYAVEGSLNDAVNLALIDWEDFEHLVRELFEEEYGGPGNEVKVTRASRDGGVDAVAFDSDPIRGGKIVIQAKRYTNTVEVSAVRDLYGTVLNEGAMKGILVTTSDYGPDAYEFAKGKPLTLLNGSNLLFLLEKHGHKAKIDLHEAKVIMAQEKANPNTAAKQ